MADFTHHAHTASLSAVAANNRFVVTGSKDETIHIYDLKKKIEHGALLQHSGECVFVTILLLWKDTVTKAALTNRKRLIGAGRAASGSLAPAPSL